MQYELPQVVVRFFFAIVVMSLMMAANAKSLHFSDTPQGWNGDQDALVNNLIDSGLRPWQLEHIAQLVAEGMQRGQLNTLNGPEFGSFDRELRSGNERKRQSRYRQCYFNPVSCFKKK